MLADIASPIYLSPPGLLVCSAISLAIIILIEATVLRLRRWGSWKIAFLHAFIINLVTSALGTGLVFFATQLRVPAEISALFLFVAAFFFTIIVEAVELKVLRLSAPFPLAFLNSMVANIFSYVFLAAMIYLALFPTVIGYQGRTGPYRRPTPVLSPGPSH
ncbi:MAG: hypothetical protein JOZ08_13220 [Verrucomicrobia bacterium]|nr:hypothetical protein [Verrucomicrobiota bacterium]MBV8276704.1 hypothetical protein [Verrucomicrobiota bacterium]